MAAPPTPTTPAASFDELVMQWLQSTSGISAEEKIYVVDASVTALCRQEQLLLATNRNSRATARVSGSTATDPALVVDKTRKQLSDYRLQLFKDRVHEVGPSAMGHDEAVAAAERQAAMAEDELYDGPPEAHLDATQAGPLDATMPHCDSPGAVAPAATDGPTADTDGAPHGDPAREALTAGE